MNPQVNMAAMNVAGGPVGGMQMMNNGVVRQEPNQGHDQMTMLNTYIYDYFLKNQQYTLAKLVLKELSVKTVSPSKSSPNHNVNGVDDMATDNKDDLHKRPDDLPPAKIPDDSGVDSCFLVDWWSQFWDIYSAQRGKVNGRPQTLQYLQYNRAKMQAQQDQQRMMMSGGRPGMMPNGMMHQNMKRAAMANAQNPTPNQLQHMQQAMNMKNQNMMQRDGSGMDINGQRPQSPGNPENAPSPSKRPRLDGGQGFNGQPMGPGRTQGMPGQPINATSAAQNQMMIANGGMPPNSMSQEQLNNFATAGQMVPGKNMEAMQKGLNPAGVPQGSPMNQQALDDTQNLFTSNPQNGIRGPPGQQGNHALQDYQMQLMLLEQQNKKRLLMARQEQDNLQQTPHPAGPVGQQPGFGQAMSPQPSRAGPSPNPSEQMKRGTPKMGQNVLPGSPMPDAMQQNRASPVPNGAFDPSQMPPGMPHQFYQQMGPGGAMNMRPPPSSHPNFPRQMTPQQIEALRATGQLPNGVQWPPQGHPQMMQPGQPGQAVAMAQQRNPMGPPPAPPAGGEPGRTQPSSPAQQPAQPPTPSQTNKAPPRKKDKPDTKKKPTKKGTGPAAGATPASESEPPPTPTPSTPITPIHQNSFSQKGGPGQPGNVQQQQPAQQAPPQMDANINQPFGSLDNPEFSMEFAPLDGPDVLDNFDFDSFLQNTEDHGAFGPLDASFPFGTDGVEAGAEM